MAVKAKGNIFYEILIVILAVGLVAAILYPSRVWQQEEEMQKICRARMTAINQMELRFKMLNQDTFTDSLSFLKEAVFNDPYAASSLDTTIQWGNLVPLKELEALTAHIPYPEALRELLQQYTAERRDLGNLAGWDDFNLALFEQMQELLTDADEEQIAAIQEHILWIYLIGEDRFFEIINSDDVPSATARQTMRDVSSRGRNIYDVRAWNEYYREPFVAAVNDLITRATDDDVWLETEKKVWEKETRALQDAELDALPEAEKDSIWLTFREEFWSVERERNWMDDQGKLWEEEREEWLEENQEMAERVIMQKWETQRKKTWNETAKEALPDSLRPQFPALRDSLWRSDVDSLRATDYPRWKAENEKEVENTYNNLWQTARRVTWEEGAYQKWLEEETGSDKFWQNVKDRLWKRSKDILWQEERNKFNRKMHAQKQLITSVKWADVLGEDNVTAIIDALDLPGNDAVWAKIKTSEDVGGALANLGLVPLYREQLLAAIDICPVSRTVYIINVVDTVDIVHCDIYCPVIDTADVAMAYDIDRAAADTAVIEIPLPTAVKILGGGEIKNHGEIVADKPSWNQKGN